MVLNKQYDFIICDLDMPVMNGYECAAKIKTHYEESQGLFNFDISQNEHQCPILVACSALVTPVIKKKTLECGFDMCVQSPISVDFISRNILPRIKLRKEEEEVKNEPARLDGINEIGNNHSDISSSDEDDMS